MKAPEDHFSNTVADAAAYQAHYFSEDYDEHDEEYWDAQGDQNERDTDCEFCNYGCEECVDPGPCCNDFACPCGNSNNYRG